MSAVRARARVSRRTLACTALAACLGLLAATPGPVRADKAGGADGALGLLATPGHFGMLRHALAPGTGDPRDFVVGDCATQRNLSAEGRAQAERIGARLRAAGLTGAKVYSSQWCRCLDTARLLDLGEVTPLPALNSFFQRLDEKAGRMRDLRSWLETQALDGPMVLVTHQVNISALTGNYAASGELLVVRRGDSGALKVVGSVHTP